MAEAFILRAGGLFDDGLTSESESPRVRHDDVQNGLARRAVRGLSPAELEEIWGTPEFRQTDVASGAEAEPIVK